MAAVDSTVLSEIPEYTDWDSLRARVKKRLEQIEKAVPQDVGNRFDRIIYPEVDWVDLLRLYHSVPFHAAAIQVKAKIVAGLGFEAPPEVEKWLEDATVNETVIDFLVRLALDLEIFGNAYVEVAYNAGGKPEKIQYVPAWTMYVKITKEDGTDWKYVQSVDLRDVEFGRFDPQQSLPLKSALLHIRRHSPLSYYYGYPEYLAALQSLEMERYIKRFHTAFFKNNAEVSKAVIFEGAKLTKAEMQTVASQFKRAQGVDNAHRLIILSHDNPNVKIRIERLSVDQKDFSFEKLYKATREEILAIHHVPPRILSLVEPGHLGGGSEAEAQMEIFKRITIRPRQRLIEEGIKRLLKAAGLPPQFRLLNFDEAIPTSKSAVETVKKSDEEEAILREIEEWLSSA